MERRRKNERKHMKYKKKYVMEEKNRERRKRGTR